MQKQELKSKMMKLWKTTFHDSDSYISLVFDNYFNPELVEYAEENGKLTSALIGIPYTFGNTTGDMKALYLCGLATEEEFRNKGIMNNLIEKINAKAKSLGYAFTFLIPASDHLINYYSRKGYVNAMYRVEDRYTEVHDFRKDYLSILVKEDERIRKLKEKYFDSLDVRFIDNNNDGITYKNELEIISGYIRNSENKISNYLTLKHAPEDISAVIKDNIISNGKIAVSRTQEGEITGVIFLTFDYRKRVVIPKIYFDDNCSHFRLLDFVKKEYADSAMSVYCYPEETQRRAIWMKTYGAPSPDGLSTGGAYGTTERVYDVSRHARPYGMIRILDIREILKFIAEDRADVKFSILVKPQNEGDPIIKCTIADGKADYSEIHPDNAENVMCISNPSITTLSTKELLELIFRKKDSSNIIMEAFGIPRLPVNMALLLD